MKVQSLIYTLIIGTGLAVSAHAKEHHTKAGLTDEVFAKKAAAGGLTEVELGKLAQQNGDSQDVKDFGAKMVADHGKANDSLKAVATKDNLTIPDKPNAEQQALIDRLSKKNGKQFDTAYVHAMVKAHEGDKALFTEEAASAKNADLKQFAEDTLPVITSHLEMIKGMDQSGGTHSTAGQGKSGTAPGGNANPGTTAPMQDKAAAGAPDTSTPNVGSSGESKSGLAPGGNANPNPATTPQ